MTFGVLQIKVLDTFEWNKEKFHHLQLVTFIAAMDC